MKISKICFSLTRFDTEISTCCLRARSEASVLTVQGKVEFRKLDPLMNMVIYSDAANAASVVEEQVVLGTFPPPAVPDTTSPPRQCAPVQRRV